MNVILVRHCSHCYALLQSTHLVVVVRSLMAEAVERPEDWIYTKNM